MKKRFVALLMAFLFAALPALSKTADEIVSCTLKARGGADKLKAIKTLKIVGTSLAQGMQTPIKLWYKTPNKLRIEVVVQNQRIVQAFDGKTGWWIMPFLGTDKPQPMPPQQVEQMKKQAEWQHPFIDYKNRGFKIDYLGTEKLGEKTVYRLKLTRPDGGTLDYIIDAKTCREIKQEATVSRGTMKYKVETFFSDYRPVSGIIFPFSMKTYVNGQLRTQLTIKSIEVNSKIDDSLFTMPSK